MTEYKKLGVEETHEGRRLRIVLRGGKGNIVDGVMAAELAEVLAERTQGRHLRCVALEAQGKDFSYGASVSEHLGDKVAPLLRNLHRAVAAMVGLEVPMTAAVRGNCLGGGLEIVLPAHRIFASADARLGQPEVTLGMFAPAGSVLLPERAGRGIAEEILLGGRILTAAEALEAGLVDEVAADPEAAAVQWFEKSLLPRSAMALRFATRAARATLIPRMNSALSQLERLFLEKTATTEDAKEGVASFLGKRRPNWVDA